MTIPVARAALAMVMEVEVDEEAAEPTTPLLGGP